MPGLRKQDLFSYKQVRSETIVFGRDISLPYRGAAFSLGVLDGSAVRREAERLPYGGYGYCRG